MSCAIPRRDDLNARLATAEGSTLSGSPLFIAMRVPLTALASRRGIH
jgi:hypothetical protein